MLAWTGALLLGDGPSVVVAGAFGAVGAGAGCRVVVVAGVVT